MTLSDAWVDFLAGWCSGAAAVVVCQPFDTILTRMQAGVSVVSSTQTSAATAGTRSAGTAANANAVAHSRTLLETAGLSALWRGSSPMITAVPLQNALLMGGYGVGQKYAEQYAPEHKLAAVFVGGSTGGFLQSFLMSPVEYIKVSQQCAAGKNVAGTHPNANANATTASSAVWKLVTQSNASVWRRGLGATLLRDGIPHGVWFTTYEVTKQELTAYYKSVRDEVHMTDNVNNINISSIDDTSQEEILVPLVAGAWAATAAWTVGYPADLIKTRIQASTGGSNSNLGIIGTGQLLIKESGGSVITGLYRGFGLKLVRSVPASMIGFSVYEYVKKHIESSL